MDLPRGWALGAIPDLLGPGGVFSDGDWVESKDQDPLGEVRLIQLADVGEGVFRDRSSRFLTASTADRLACTHLRAGDVLVARMPDPLGRACTFPGAGPECVTVVDVCIVRPGAGAVDAGWLMWALNAPQMRSRVSALQAGTTRKRISRRNLASIEFPVPPLAEQRRIVAAIEEQLSRLDAADASLVAAGQRVEAFQRRAFDTALSGDWPWTTLGDIAEIAGGVTKDSKRQDDPGLVEVPYLRVANVQRGFLDLGSVATIRVAPEKVSALALRPGDVLFNEGGDRDKLGRGWVWNGEIEPCIHQNHSSAPASWTDSSRSSCPGTGTPSGGNGSRQMVVRPRTSPRSTSRRSGDSRCLHPRWTSSVASSPSWRRGSPCSTPHGRPSPRPRTAALPFAARSWSAPSGASSSPRIPPTSRRPSSWSASAPSALRSRSRGGPAEQDPRRRRSMSIRQRPLTDRH